MSEEVLVEMLARAAPATRATPVGGRCSSIAGTAAIVRRWGQPEWLQRAALIHSVYGTEAYSRRLISLDRREEMAELAGTRAERLAHLFATTPRARLLEDTHPLAREDADALVLLHMANLAEQAQARDGAPAPWLVRLRELAELLIDSDTIRLPLFVAGLASLSEGDEALGIDAYRAGLDGEPERASLWPQRCVPWWPRPSGAPRLSSRARRGTWTSQSGGRRAGVTG